MAHTALRTVLDTLRRDDSGLNLGESALLLGGIIIVVIAFLIRDRAGTVFSDVADKLESIVHR